MNDEFATPTPAMHMPDMGSMSSPTSSMPEPEHVDDEVRMSQSQLYRAAKNSIELHKMLKFVSELEGWVQAKITIAAENLEAVKNYIEYEMVSQTLAESNATNEGIGDVLQGLKKGAKEFWRGSPEEHAAEHKELMTRWLTALSKAGVTGRQARDMAEKMIAQGFEPNQSDLKEGRKLKKRA